MGTHQEEETNTSYYDSDLPLDNDKIPPSNQDMPLDKMERILNLVSRLTKEMSFCAYSTDISYHTIIESCIIHTFGFHSKISFPNFLLA